MIWTPSRFAVMMFSLTASAALGTDVPNYSEGRLDGVFPAGGRRGQSIAVRLFGNNGGLRGASSLVIEGPSGITARDIKNVDSVTVEATLDIDADAPIGRRSLRVVSERGGISNMTYFVVGELPECVEQEPNNDLSSAQPVVTPIVINGALDQSMDLDCFRWEAKRGQNFVLTVSAHALDVRGQGSAAGLLNTSLQLLTPEGEILAEAEDTLGLDPVIQFQAPRDGTYVARIHTVTYSGFREAVYRLTVGDVPIVTSVFPAGGRHGSPLDVEFDGINFPKTIQRLTTPTNDGSPVSYVAPQGLAPGGHDVRFHWDDGMPVVEQEPNQDRSKALEISLPGVADGRFDSLEDEDWYRVTLKAGQNIWLDVFGQRFLRSPIDPRIEVFQEDGKLVAENDDGCDIDYVSMHDFKSFDSRLKFEAEHTGNYYLRVTNQSGTSGSRAVYRMRVLTEPEFRLYAYPDGVPIWGPGTTAALLVCLERDPGMDADIELTVDGLPEGWTGSSMVSPGRRSERKLDGQDRRVFLTITAPSAAAIGTHVPFRIVGRTNWEGKAIERVALPLTLYYSSDIGFFRITSTMRAAVAGPRGIWFESEAKELQLVSGMDAKIPVIVRGLKDETKLDVVVNEAFGGTGCAANAPITLPIVQGRVEVPVKLHANWSLGPQGIVVARTWGSDIRLGMPGPCTPLIRLVVQPHDKSP